MTSGCVKFLLWASLIASICSYELKKVDVDLSKDIKVFTAEEMKGYDGSEVRSSYDSCIFMNKI